MSPVGMLVSTRIQHKWIIKETLFHILNILWVFQQKHVTNIFHCLDGMKIACWHWKAIFQNPLHLADQRDTDSSCLPPHASCCRSIEELPGSADRVWKGRNHGLFWDLVPWFGFPENRGFPRSSTELRIRWWTRKLHQGNVSEQALEFYWIITIRLHLCWCWGFTACRNLYFWPNTAKTDS